MFAIYEFLLMLTYCFYLLFSEIQIGGDAGRAWKEDLHYLVFSVV